MHPFDLALSHGSSVGTQILSPLLEVGIVPTVLDIGARSGLFFLPPGYTSEARLVGFEPNQEEYELLVAERTAAMVAGERQPTFKEKVYFNFAVWDEEEERDFFIKIGPGACTMMGETDTTVTQRMFLDGPNGSDDKSFEERHTRTIKVEPMRCNSLDSLSSKDPVDLLKIDVEGAELRVLKGAKALLENQKILFIKTEFAMFPIYTEHPLLGDLQLFLHKYGFRLVHLDLEHPTYNRYPTSIPPSHDRRGQYSGDAYLILDPDRHDMQPLMRQRLAAISLALGFKSLAVSLIRDAGLLPESTIEEIEAVLAKRAFLNRLLQAWHQFPYTAQRHLAKLRR